MKGGCSSRPLNTSVWRTFGQEPPPAWGIADLETEYLRLKREWALERELYDREFAEIADDPAPLAALEGRYPNRGSFVIMPPIPWNPYQNDFWYNEILNEVQAPHRRRG